MELQKRKPNRLKNYDYSQNGAYFITICVQDRKPILSQIIVGEGLAPPVLKLLPFGECIKEQINNLEIRYENVKIDNYVIMPNHIHILMRIENQTGGASPSPTVSDIICAFKSLSTLECKKLLPIDILFQRSYHDHIIRDDIDYQQICNILTKTQQNGQIILVLRQDLIRTTDGRPYDNLIDMGICRGVHCMYVFSCNFIHSMLQLISKCF